MGNFQQLLDLEGQITVLKSDTNFEKHLTKSELLTFLSLVMSFHI